MAVDDALSQPITHTSSVVEFMGNRRVALMCFEHDEHRYHRQCIIERAIEREPRLPVVRLEEVGEDAAGSTPACNLG